MSKVVPLEEHRERRAKDLANHYYTKYRDQIDLLEHSTLAKVKGRIDIYDVYALGKQLEQFDTLQRLCEEQGNTALLGTIPTIAYDVITAVHGASVIPIMASVQPIEDEQGIVYFRTTRTTTNKGSQTNPPQVVTDPRLPLVYQQNYASNSITVTQAMLAGTAQTINLTTIPIRSQSLVIGSYVTATGAATGINAKDMGPATSSGPNAEIGIIWGNGVSGTVNYRTGIVALVFAIAQVTTDEMRITYQQNIEMATDLPQIDMYFDSKAIKAKMYALKSTVGLLQSYGMQKRFGKIAEDEMSKDLVQEINKEIGGDIVRLLQSQAMGINGTTGAAATFVTWPLAPAAGVSDFDHRQSYKFRLADAESVLSGNSGRGTISLMVVGRNQAAVIQTLPGFEKISDGNTLGMHVFGTLDGVPIIRVVENTLMPTNEGICMWKGTSPWEASVVYSPFMPLTMTDLLPMAPNPLIKMRAAAVWAGVDVIVPQYATKMNIIP